MVRMIQMSWLENAESVCRDCTVCVPDSTVVSTAAISHKNYMQTNIVFGETWTVGYLFFNIFLI